MAERLLVTKIKRTSATQAELYGARHKYPDLRLFDIAELATVNIDPEHLTIGQEQPCRFWAIYELSEKLNKAGHPYRDVVALEAMSALATTTSTAVGDSAILSELRRTNSLLLALLAAQGVAAPRVEPEPEQEPEPEISELDEALPRYGDGRPVGDNEHEISAFRAYKATHGGHAPASVEVLRSWVIQTQRNGKH